MLDLLWDIAITINQSCFIKKWLPNSIQAYNSCTWISANHTRSHMTTQTTLCCLPFDYSDQLQPCCQTSQSQAQEMISSPANHRLKKWCHPQQIAGSRIDVISEWCISNTPYTRTCISPAGWTSKEAENKQGEQRDEQRASSKTGNKEREKETEKGDRAREQGQEQS